MKDWLLGDKRSDNKFYPQSAAPDLDTQSNNRFTKFE